MQEAWPADADDFWEHRLRGQSRSVNLHQGHLHIVWEPERPEWERAITAVSFVKLGEAEDAGNG